MNLNASFEIRPHGRMLALVLCWFVTVLSLLLSLTLLLFSLIVVPEPLSGYEYMLFLAVPWIIGLVVLSGMSLVTYYLVVVSAILVSFMLLAESDMGSSLKKLSNTLSRLQTPGLWDDNYWVMMPRFLSISIFVPTIWYGVVGVFGPSPAVPGFSSFPIWEQFFGFAAASFWEEVVFRFFLLGVPLFILSSRKDMLRFLARGKEDVSTEAIYLLVISSLIFAAAHAFGGWDWYKVPPTFFTGMALGYVFLKRGLPGSIILHFSLNYFTLPLVIFPWLIGVFLFMFFIMVICGGYYSLAYSKNILLSLQKKRNTWRPLGLW